MMRTRTILRRVSCKKMKDKRNNLLQKKADSLNRSRKKRELGMRKEKK